MKYELKRGTIVLMDALGTKNRWKNESVDDIIENIEGLIGLTELAASRVNSNDRHRMEVKSFSDTILITFTEKETLRVSQKKTKFDYDNLELASLTSGLLLVLGLSLNIPFRGCISFGDFYMGERILLGHPINEASEYYEQPNWIGLSLAPSTLKLIPNIVLPFDSNFVRYDIPLKTQIEKMEYLSIS